MMRQTCLSPGLSGVQETMLWALHDRAYAAKQPNGGFRDPQCVNIYDSIDYEFVSRFGTPRSNLAAARASMIDRTLRRWVSSHPRGFVVSLGEGLETQAYRVDNGQIRWLSLDLMDAIEFRERFMKPRREATREILNRAIKRGEIDQGLDHDRIIDLIFGPMVFRLMAGHGPLNKTEADAMISILLRGIGRSSALSLRVPGNKSA